MKFGPTDVSAAKGAILAHAVKTGDGRLKKGKILGAADIDALRDSGIEQVIVARLEDGDIGENDAAKLIAAAMMSGNVDAEAPFTGRVNLFSKNAGLLQIDAGIINQINRIDPGITVATLAQLSPVEAGRMIATVKIIPFAVEHQKVDKAIAILAASNALHLSSFKAKRIGLIATRLPSLKLSTMDKTRDVLAGRLALSNSKIVEELRVAHNAIEVAAAIKELKRKCDLLVLFGASAITDIEDVIPSGLRKAGGDIEHFGMPVDPGNLLLLGKLGKLSVLGAPGCARSPRENGFDWILQRLLADIPVNRSDIEGMGVGGLLMEIHSRPQPRQQLADNNGNIHALVLAAGQSRRMGETNKLLAKIYDKSLVRRAVETALASKVSGITVVTGFEADKIERELAGLDVKFANNEHYATGLASSLRCGVATLPKDCSGVLVMLGDMPHITTPMIDQMVKAFNNASPSSIIQAASHGKRGNPVLWGAEYFDDLCQISGDVGARHLIGENSDNVIVIELGDAAAMDIDTPAELLAQGGFIEGEN